MTLLKTGLWWPNGIAWRNNSLYVTGFYNDTGVMQGYIARWDDIDSFALNNLVRARCDPCLACSVDFLKHTTRRRPPRFSTGAPIPPPDVSGTRCGPLAQTYTGVVTNITKALPGRTYHGWRYIDFGPDGKLYCAIGAPFNIGIPPTFTYTDPVSGATSENSFASIVRIVRSIVAVSIRILLGDIINNYKHNNTNIKHNNLNNNHKT